MVEDVIDNSLGADDRLMVFLDDVYVVTFREHAGRVWERAARVMDSLQESHPRRQTQVWNSGGERPEFCDVLERQIQKLECGEGRRCQLNPTGSQKFRGSPFARFSG